ncbi:hypothetical protein KSU88_15100, partial [[Clostridium] innocuum]|uniref:hypothetical protein n=1 Tax=Clostridium innocuum TaxID=1522 RepID=UPI001C38BFD5
SSTFFIRLLKVEFNFSLQLFSETQFFIKIYLQFKSIQKNAKKRLNIVLLAYILSILYTRN